MRRYTLKPPLATDFFQQLLEGVRQVDLISKEHREHFKALYDDIERYWRLKLGELRGQHFDLADCFTRVQQQKDEAEQEGNLAENRKLLRIEHELVELLKRLFSMFDIIETLFSTSPR